MEDRLISICTGLQMASAATFESFLVLHLVAPGVALIAPPGTSAADRGSACMLLSRVYYQSGIGEVSLVWGALGLHISAGLIKRLLRSKRRQRQFVTQDEQESKLITQNQSWTSNSVKWISLLAVKTQACVATFLGPITRLAQAGWVLVPLVAQHAYLNRVVPSRDELPIRALSPAELEYTYVSYGLSSFPLRTYASYLPLIALTAYHVSYGTPRAWAYVKSALLNRKRASVNAQEDGGGGDSSTAKLTKRSRWLDKRKVATVVLATTLTGSLIRLHWESPSELASLPRRLIRRFDVCYSLVWPYSLTK